MSSGPTHRAISRLIAAPTAVAVGVASDDWYVAIVVGVACALSGCGPDWDQAEARLSPAWKVGGWAAWIVIIGRLVWWLKDAPIPPPSP